MATEVARPAPRPTMPTITQSKRPILIYPTVSPESIIVPIVSCILGFPILALLLICCLRRRAKLARARARRRNCDVEHGALSLVRFSPVHRLAGIEKPPKAMSIRADRGSRAFAALELDTVLEERSDPEMSTAVEISSPE
ncbi:hypothetical protein TSAR_010469 [Trichomalopsis sarcophagae]|uniref:Uncharacterized protein n=1 Tax=Trichomalopsis sarcophagae TaxID=543379 RepID=A0A232F9K8_9HYME|nr:hypothetical protein TSAR_010469 [Trichomalopsis sarcophagae]